MLPLKVYLYSHSLELEWTIHQVLDGKIIEKFWKWLQSHFFLTTTVGSNLTWGPTMKTIHVNYIKAACVHTHTIYLWTIPSALMHCLFQNMAQISFLKKMSALYHYIRQIKVSSLLILSWEYLDSSYSFNSRHHVSSTWNTNSMYISKPVLLLFKKIPLYK